MADFVIENNCLVKYEGNEENVVIPEGIDTIGENAFADNNSVRSVVVPNGVKYILENAFLNMDNLENVFLPEGLEVVGVAAFASCKKLATINFPATLKKISKRAFFACESLKEIEIPEGVAHIESNAFANCKNLTRVVLPSSIEKFGNFVFYSYQGHLEEITISSPYCCSYTDWYPFNLKKVYNYSNNSILCYLSRDIDLDDGYLPNEDEHIKTLCPNHKLMLSWCFLLYPEKYESCQNIKDYICKQYKRVLTHCIKKGNVGVLAHLFETKAPSKEHIKYALSIVRDNVDMTSMLLQYQNTHCPVDPQKELQSMMRALNRTIRIVEDFKQTNENF